MFPEPIRLAARKIDLRVMDKALPQGARLKNRMPSKPTLINVRKRVKQATLKLTKPQRIANKGKPIVKKHDPWVDNPPVTRHANLSTPALIKQGNSRIGRTFASRICAARAERRAVLLANGSGGVKRTRKVRQEQMDFPRSASVIRCKKS